MQCIYGARRLSVYILCDLDLVARCRRNGQKNVCLAGYNIRSIRYILVYTCLIAYKSVLGVNHLMFNVVDCVFSSSTYSHIQ